MSGSIDFKCDFCQKRAGASPEERISLPEKWVSIQTNRGRLHACASCWRTAAESLAKVERVAGPFRVDEYIKAEDIVGSKYQSQFQNSAFDFI